MAAPRSSLLPLSGTSIRDIQPAIDHPCARLSHILELFERVVLLAQSVARLPELGLQTPLILCSCRKVDPLRGPGPEPPEARLDEQPAAAQGVGAPLVARSLLAAKPEALVRQRIALLICWVWCLPFVAHADPVRITSGHVHVFDADTGAGCDGPCGESDFSLKGAGLDLTGGGFDFDFPFAGWMIGEGQPASALSSSIAFDGFLESTFESISGNFTFTTPHSRIACTEQALSSNTCLATGRFTFRGSISSVPKLLVGTGTATGGIPGPFSGPVLDYVFDAAPTPEPATVILMCGGLVLLTNLRRERTA